MPPEIQRLTDQFLHNPVRIEVSRPATTAANITQEVVEVPANDWAKREALRRLIREAEPTLNNAIVFCNRKRDVDVVAKIAGQARLRRRADPWRSRPVAAHQDPGRVSAPANCKILVASDVAARGLDIPAVSHVFNFDVPIHADDYVHRIGRTGRAGRSGHAYMLATPRDAKYLEAIEKITGNRCSAFSLEGSGRRGRSSALPASTSIADAANGIAGADATGIARPVADHGHRASMEPAQARCRTRSAGSRSRNR